MTEKRKLSTEEVAEKLNGLPGWTVEEGKLARLLNFRNFEDAFAFMTRCAFEIEKMDHHPEWSNVYRRVKIELSTHEVGGISSLDFELASRINVVLEAFRQA